MFLVRRHSYAKTNPNQKIGACFIESVPQPIQVMGTLIIAVDKAMNHLTKISDLFYLFQPNFKV